MGARAPGFEPVERAQPIARQQRRRGKGRVNAPGGALLDVSAKGCRSLLHRGRVCGRLPHAMNSARPAGAAARTNEVCRCSHTSGCVRGKSQRGPPTAARSTSATATPASCIWRIIRCSCPGSAGQRGKTSQTGDALADHDVQARACSAGRPHFRRAGDAGPPRGAAWSRPAVRGRNHSRSPPTSRATNGRGSAAPRRPHAGGRAAPP